MTGENDKIAKEGIAPIVLFGAATISSLWIYWPLAVVFFALFLFTLYFFRNPDRQVPVVENAIICPADGTIIAVDELEEKEFIKQKMRHIAVFMSPMDVHVNRAPASGEVVDTVYRKGRFKAAFDERAGELNERSILRLKTDRGDDIVFMQIAGWFARRIVTYAKKGDRLRAGDIFGLIKFGSRMEIYYPESFSAQVRVGDKVKAGTTILAKKS